MTLELGFTSRASCYTLRVSGAAPASNEPVYLFQDQMSYLNLLLVMRLSRVLLPMQVTA